MGWGYPVPECAKIDFESKSDLIAHWHRVHNPTEQPYQCPENGCKFVARKQTVINRHFKLSHGKRHGGEAEALKYLKASPPKIIDKENKFYIDPRNFKPDFRIYNKEKPTPLQVQHVQEIHRLKQEIATLRQIIHL